MLPVGKETLRNDKMEIVLCPRHSHVEEPPFFFELCTCACAQIRWHTSIDDVEHEDRLPFLPLAGMDLREDQMVLVKQRHARLVAGGIGRIECEFRQVYKFLFDLTGGGNWLVDVHASS